MFSFFDELRIAKSSHDEIQGMQGNATSYQFCKFEPVFLLVCHFCFIWPFFEQSLHEVSCKLCFIFWKKNECSNLHHVSKSKIISWESENVWIISRKSFEEPLKGGFGSLGILDLWGGSEGISNHFFCIFSLQLALGTPPPVDKPSMRSSDMLLDLPPFGFFPFPRALPPSPTVLVAAARSGHFISLLNGSHANKWLEGGWTPLALNMRAWTQICLRFRVFWDHLSVWVIWQGLDITEIILLWNILLIVLNLLLLDFWGMPAHTLRSSLIQCWLCFIVCPSMVCTTHLFFYAWVWSAQKMDLFPILLCKISWDLLACFLVKGPVVQVPIFLCIV